MTKAAVSLGVMESSPTLKAALQRSREEHIRSMYQAGIRMEQKSLYVMPRASIFRRRRSNA